MDWCKTKTEADLFTSVNNLDSITELLTNCFGSYFQTPEVNLNINYQDTLGASEVTLTDPAG